MKNQLTPFREFRRPNFSSRMHIAAVVALLGLIGIPLFSSSSASSKRDARIGEPVGMSGTLLLHDSNKQQSLLEEYMRNARVADSMLELPQTSLGTVSAVSFLFQVLPVEGVATYSVDSMGACTTTPQISFALGDRVCARVVNAPSGQRRINWIGASGFVASSDDLMTEENIFTLPMAAASRGLWFVGDVSSADGALYAAAAFAVRDPDNPSADLAVNMANSFEASAGGNLSFILQVANNGPDTAHDIIMTNLSPVGTSFLGITQEPGGPLFSCDPGAGFTCTTASFAKGDVASFTIVYQVAPATPDGTVISNIVTITSSTTELKPNDNTVLSDATVSASADSESCTLACPSDIVTTANTTQSGQPGAFVTYGAAQGFGSCGSISNTPASGSFFAVGLHTVSSDSSAGPSCTFTVNVLDSAAPTISCPPDRTATAPDGSDEATVDPGLPTTNPSTDVTVVGERSDSTPAVLDDQGNIINPAVSVPLTDPYPVGITGITWTVTDAAGRKATCQQRITVNGNACGGDTEPPTITAPADLTVFTGPDNTGCSLGLDDELGQATAHDNCTVTISVAGIPANNAFPPGNTTLTYTATDGVGQTASDTQVVTVIDNTPPSIAAPPNASYVCLSQVPAASPSQATRGTVLDENGNPLPPGPPFDNCGIPAVTVSETSSGAGSTASPRIITRTFTASDGVGNSSNAVQTITVIDPTPPTFTSVPANVVAYTGPGAVSCGTTVSDATLGNATAQDNCSVVVTRSGVPAGNNFPVGNTTVTYTATDGAGNTATAAQTVTVVDNTPPTISCPANLTVNFNPAVNGAVVTYTAPVGSDNCTGATTARTAGLASGATFPLGTTTNTFRVTDAAGNTTECSFKITVALTSIIGRDSVSIGGSGQVDSYDSTVGYPASKTSLASIVSNGTITLTNSGKVWGSVRSTTAGVVMSGASQITGNATAGTTVSLSGSATVGGTITNNAPVPATTLPAVPACGPPYSPNSGITGTYSYNSSTGNLSLSGVNIATLANGAYCFNNITLTNSAQLKVNGPVVIKLMGTLNASGATNINNTTADPSNLRILSSYTGNNGVIVSNSANARLVIYAPNTGATISGAGPLFGTVAAKTVTISNSGAIHYDTRLTSIWADMWTLILGP